MRFTLDAIAAHMYETLQSAAAVRSSARQSALAREFGSEASKPATSTTGVYGEPGDQLAATWS